MKKNERGDKSLSSIRSIWAAAIAAVLLLLSGPALSAREAWSVFKNCRLIENDSNDGDSFHVNARGREYVLRLYFADAPETDATFPERVAEQAGYFRLTSPQALELGAHARRF